MSYLIHFEDGSSAVLAHHGVDGMKWGVWNEETQRKYGASGGNISGGGGRLEDMNEKLKANTDEARDKANKGVLSKGEIQQMKNFEHNSSDGIIYKHSDGSYTYRDKNGTSNKDAYMRGSVKPGKKSTRSPGTDRIDANVVEKGRFNKNITIVSCEVAGSEWNEGKGGYDDVYDYKVVGKTNSRV